MNDFFRMIKRLDIWRKYIILLILRSPFDALRTWMMADLMKSTFLCVETSENSKLLSMCVAYGLICTLLFFYNGTIWSIYAAFAAKVEARLQKLLIERILSLPYRRVDSSMSGEWLTRLNSDIQAAITIMNAPGNIPHVVVAILNTLLSSFLMCGNSPLLFAVTGAFILPHLFINYRIVLRHMPGLREASQKAMAENTSAIEPLITEADTILLYDAGTFILKKCEESSLKLVRINMSMHMRNAFSNVVLRLFGSCGYLTILLLGLMFIDKDTMAFSDLVYSLQVRGSVLTGVFMVINCWNNIKGNSVCVKRINDTFAE